MNSFSFEYARKDIAGTGKKIYYIASGSTHLSSAPIIPVWILGSDVILDVYHNAKKNLSDIITNQQPKNGHRVEY